MDETHLEDLEVLCRLVLAARRLGCRVVITDLPPALRELVESVGLADALLGDSSRPEHGDRPER